MGFDSPDDELEAAVSLLYDLVKSYRTSLALTSDIADLPFGQLRVLAYLYRAPRSTVGDVAGGLSVSLATASELLDRMVDSGWVERHADPNDRRKVLVTLTERARDCGDRIHATRRQQVEAALATLDDATRAAFVAGLRAVVDAIAASPRAEQTVAGS